MQQTRFRLSLSGIEDLSREWPCLPEAFVKEMDKLVKEDEAVNGAHSIEFQLGVVTAITFMKRLLEGCTPEVKEDVLQALPVYVCYNFVTTMEVIGPRPRLQ